MHELQSINPKHFDEIAENGHNILTLHQEKFDNCLLFSNCTPKFGSDRN